MKYILILWLFNGQMVIEGPYDEGRCQMLRAALTQVTLVDYSQCAYSEEM